MNIQTGLGRGVKVSPSFQIGFMDQLFFCFDKFLDVCVRASSGDGSNDFLKIFLILDPMTNQHVPDPSSLLTRPPN